MNDDFCVYCVGEAVTSMSSLLVASVYDHKDGVIQTQLKADRPGELVKMLETMMTKDPDATFRLNNTYDAIIATMSWHGNPCCDGHFMRIYQDWCNASSRPRR